MAGEARQASGSTGRGPHGHQRHALLIFGAGLVLLFAGFAIAQGIGAPSVPAGDVAVVQGVPDGAIGEREFERALEAQVAQGKLKKAPAPGTKKYDELKTATMNELLNGVWLRGEARELGISVTKKQIEAELARVKRESFPTAGAYKKFLRESHFTQQDVNDRVEQQLLGSEIQKKVNGEAPKPSHEEIAAYYEAEKATKLTTKASRDVRVVVNEDKVKIEAAAKALKKDSSVAGWKRAVGKYSSNSTLKAQGGLQPGVTEEFLKEPLKAAIFNNPPHQLVGPLHYESNYFELEVVKVNPPKTKTLAEAESEITTTLGQEKQQAFFSEFVAAFQRNWPARTVCASGFVVEGCVNYKGSGHPKTASASCYEANPKAPATECPAPVQQVRPAMPGTVTTLSPTGEQRAQGPHP